VAGIELAEILCIQKKRHLGDHNCVPFATLRLRIPESPFRRRDESDSKRLALLSSGPRANAIDLGQSILNVSSRFERAFANGA
jgi:hypothetical protein